MTQQMSIFIRNIKGIWGPKEISELKKNDVAEFKQQGENPRSAG
jgi:hypothetical protein